MLHTDVGAQPTSGNGAVCSTTSAGPSLPSRDPTTTGHVHCAYRHSLSSVPRTPSSLTTPRNHCNTLPPTNMTTCPTAKQLDGRTIHPLLP